MQIYDIPIDREGKELTTVGTVSFPIAVYETQLSKNILGYVNWHWHKAIQLCLVKKGAVAVHVNRQEYILHQGEGCFIHTNILHMIRPVEDPNSTYICINAELPLISGFPQSVIHEKYILPTLKDPDFAACALRPAIPHEKTILESIQAIFDADTVKPCGYELQIIIELLRIWNQLILSRQNTDKTMFSAGETQDSRIKVLLFFLQNHYGEKLSLEQIAKEIHLCPGECCRFFKRNMGKTIFAYLQEYRIEQSIQSLRETTKPISEIAYECGFSSTSHYIDRFKKHTGITPLEYRKRHK